MSSNNPYDAIGGKTWLKGMRLGMILVVLFAVSAIVAFGLLSLMGMNAGNSLILAAILGPAIGTACFIGWWLVTKPTLSDIDSGDKEESA